MLKELRYNLEYYFGPMQSMLKVPLYTLEAYCGAMHIVL